MYFVGREKETKQIIKALKRGDNVILMGKYGIGRTSLAKHIADITLNRLRFIFVDFSQTPGKVCRHLMDRLLAGKSSKEHGKALGYKSIRFRISTQAFADKRQPVLVLDNIGKLSAQKLDLIRYLAMTKRFLFVAIVENFLQGEKLFSLRTWLTPASLTKVSYLSKQSGREFFHHYAAKHRLHWTESEIRTLAEMTGGYPLGMKEVLTRKLEHLGSMHYQATLQLQKTAGGPRGFPGQESQ
jgi:hypothetical protein